MEFLKWLSNREIKSFFESSLSSLLKVPQNPKHHQEGDVLRHTTMVRSSIDSAIKLLQQKQHQDPSGPFANLDLNFTKEDYNLLRIAGWLHDIGKSVTTDLDKLTAHGHEDPKNFEKAMNQLGPSWKKMYDSADSSDKEDLWFIIQHHMNLSDSDGFGSKKLKSFLLDDQGNYRSDRRIKLLLVLLLMDRLGRGGSPDSTVKQAKQFAINNIEPGQRGIEGMYSSSQWAKDNALKIASHQSKPTPNDPMGFVTNLRNKGKNSEIIRQALASKFKDLSSSEIDHFVGESRMNFKNFYESEEENKSATMKASIPLPKHVFDLSKIFKNNGFSLYVVGGAVRDYLMHKFAGESGQYKPKDIDLSTDAPPREVERILNAAGVRNFEKGESFGVWVAHIDGEDYEIATFREDLGYSDGRRPDAVKWASPESDYKRRDLTMNALFYNIPSESGKSGEIIDHGGGQGIEDIKAKKVRVVGDPYDRFGEDKLRIPRIARFHSRYNDGDVKDTLDQRTLDAIDKFKDLRGHGVSGPRIQQEFLAGLEKSKDTRSFLKNYDSLGLLPAVFPGLELDMDAVESLHDPQVNKNPIIVLALLLRKNGTPDKIRSSLNRLNWPNEISDEVSFLLKTWRSAKNPSSDTMTHAAGEIKKNPYRRELLDKFGGLIGPEVDQSHWSHLSQYDSPTFSGEEIKNQYGIAPGPEMGKKQRELKNNHYEDSYKKWSRR